MKSLFNSKKKVHSESLEKMIKKRNDSNKTIKKNS